MVLRASKKNKPLNSVHPVFKFVQIDSSMISGSKSDTYYLALCREKIEEKLGWGSSEQWTHADFLAASENISEEAHINLSVTTIKRLWGKVNYKGSPSVSTLNALAVYLGYENWKDFKLDQDEKLEEGAELFQDAGEVIFQGRDLEERKEKQRPKIKPGKIPLLSILIFLTLAILFYSAKNKGEVKVTPGKIVFNSEPLAKGIPNTVVFNYDISNLDFDSAFIQQNWDARRRQRIYKENKQITSVYYYPGHFNAKLVINDKVIKEHGLLIPSRGWLGLVDREGSTAPVYIKEQDLKGKGTLHAPVDVLEAKNIDTGKDFSLTYSNAREFGIKGDHFSLETAIRNNPDNGGGICQESVILIDGEKGIFWLPLSSLGCVGNISLQFGEVFVSGKTTDLSAFGADLSKWNFISLQVKNQNVEILLDDQLIYSVEYKEPIGKIMGINFRFQGAGEVDYVRLKDENGELAYKDEFLPE